MMYVKIKKIYMINVSVHNTLKHITLTYECVFLYTRVFKKTKTKKTRNFTTTTKIYLNMMFVYYFHHLHHFQLSTRDL